MTQYQEPGVNKDMSPQARPGGPMNNPVSSQSTQEGAGQNKVETGWQMLTPAERARREEYLQSINEARWFATAFIAAVCVCFLLYIVL